MRRPAKIPPQISQAPTQRANSQKTERCGLRTPLRSERPSATGNLRVFSDEPPWTMRPPAEDLSAVLSSICANSESAAKGEFLCALMLSDYKKKSIQRFLTDCAFSDVLAAALTFARDTFDINLRTRQGDRALGKVGQMS